ncbi:hypothetical protein [Pedobacter sp. NJ-S-72]
MQGRATFSPGIDKAATFIEAEFKKIGLQPLKGAASYRQTFYKYQVKPTSAEVSIDGKAITPAEVAIWGNTAATLNLDNTNSDGWVKLDPSKSFREQYRLLVRNKKRQLVLVDKKNSPMNLTS